MKLSRAKAILNSLIRNGKLKKAKRLIGTYKSPNTHLSTIMINAYADVQNLQEALKVFDEMPTKDLISYNSILNCCFACNDIQTAHKLFDQMPTKNIVSFTTMLHGYFKHKMVKQAECLFRTIPQPDVAACNALIHGYFQNGYVDEGVRFFQNMTNKDVVSWTCVIQGLDFHSRSEEALHLFRSMWCSTRPNATTFSCVLSCCSHARNARFGFQVHGLAVKTGKRVDEYVLASLVAFYGSCGMAENGTVLVGETPTGNVVVWTSVLSGFVTNLKKKSFEVFRSMVRIRVLPNQSTFCIMMKLRFDLEIGEMIHVVAVKLGFERDTSVGNSLITMYSDCGSLNQALRSFIEVETKNEVTWTAAIVASGRHGEGGIAWIVFSQMLRSGGEIDDVMILGLLSSCSYGGDWRRGLKMVKYVGGLRGIEQLACVVDMVGRMGEVELAEEMVEELGIGERIDGWLAVLGAAEMHRNVEVGERAAEKVFEMEENCSAAYMMLSNSYGGREKWEEIWRLRMRMKKKSVRKLIAKSWWNK